MSEESRINTAESRVALQRQGCLRHFGAGPLESGQLDRPARNARLDLARACLSNLTDLHLDYAALSLPGALTIPIATIPDNCGFIELVRREASPDRHSRSHH
jgi:hypothetical protein